MTQQHDYEAALSDIAKNDPYTKEWAEAIYAHIITIRHALKVAQKAQWITTHDRLPRKPGVKSYEYVDCLIYYRGEVLQRPWNCEHLCWDDEHYDDHFCNATEPTHWMPLPSPPAAMEEINAEGGK